MMKPITVCALFAVIMGSLVQRVERNVIQAPQRGYPLVCRGGGELHFNYTPFSNLSPDPQIWITFERAPGAVGAQWENAGALQPGQCAWLDRAVSESEPNQIALLGVQRFSIQWQRGQVTGISSELTPINQLQDPTKYQAFTVTNNGQGFFVVTGVGLAR
jgi:hypothetical protein